MVANSKDILLYFNTKEEIRDQLNAMAEAFVASELFSVMRKHERKQWLFLHNRILDHFQQMEF